MRASSVFCPVFAPTDRMSANPGARFRPPEGRVHRPTPGIPLRTAVRGRAPARRGLRPGLPRVRRHPAADQ